MDQRHLQWIDSQADAMARLLVGWVNINSGSHHLPGLSKMLAALEQEFAALGGRRERIDLPAAREVDAQGNAVEKELGSALRIIKRPDAPLRVLLNIHY